MSDFKKEMIREAKVRIASYEKEKSELLKAPDRIAQLDTLIAEANELVGNIEITL